MCCTCEVTIPTVRSFLLMYPLYRGSIVIMVWTVLRSFLSVFFFTVVACEVLLKKKLPFGGITVTDMSIETVSPDNVIPVYFCLIGMILQEAFLFIFSWYAVRGLCLQRSKYFVHYLICRLITWIGEVSFLALLCVFHDLHIGWYLGILFFVVLEAYSFIVVYSYYCVLWDCEHPCKLEDFSTLSQEN